MEILCLKRGDKKGHDNDRLCSSISKKEVRNALRKMKIRKAVSPNFIPVKMPNKWRTGTIILLYKNNGDI